MFLPDGRLIGAYDGLTGAVVREYIWMDERLAGTVDAAGTLQFIQTGPLGQPLIVINASGLVIWRGELAPFGELVSSAFGPVPEARFLGQWDEAGSGLYQNWHRTYDASLGREARPLGPFHQPGDADEFPLADAEGREAAEVEEVGHHVGRTGRIGFGEA